MIPLLLPSFLLLLASAAFGQEWAVHKKVNLNRAQVVAADSKGHIFVATRNGSVFKYEKGEESLNYSPERQMPIDQMEPWNGLRIMTFNEDMQNIKLLDRFLAGFRELDLASLGQIGFVSAATYSQAGQLLLFDQSQLDLLFVNPSNNSIERVMPLRSVPELVNLKILQITAISKHIVLLAEKKVVILDNFGNFKQAVDVSPTKRINYWDEKLYFASNGTYFVLHIQTAEIESIPLDTEVTFDGICRTKDYLLGWNSAQMIYFSPLK